MSSVFFAQIEFLHTVCKNLDNLLANPDCTVQKIIDDYRVKKDKLSKAMYTVMVKVRCDARWLYVYMPRDEPKPDNYDACYEVMCRRHVREESIDGLKSLMRGVRYTQDYVKRSGSSRPTSGVEMQKRLYEERAWYMRWQADQYLDTSDSSEERRELELVVEAIKACEYAWELDARIPDPDQTIALEEEEEDWDLPTTPMPKPAPKKPIPDSPASPVLRSSPVNEMWD